MVEQKILALDLSTKTGWASFTAIDKSTLSLSNFGVIKNKYKIGCYGEYPFSYIFAAEAMCGMIIQKIEETRPNVIVIEETNKSKARYTQKILEFIHCILLYKMWESQQPQPNIVYVNSSEWRKVLGLTLSKQDKKNNKKLKSAKQLAEMTGSNFNKTELGIKGTITKKHISVRYANDTFGLKLKQKDNDIADAICLGSAYIYGAKLCDGK